jgi:hypothetical protein
MSNRLSLYLQAVRGPLLLITLGVLCALHESDMVSFRYTWPVLIIMVGLLVLIERAVVPPVVATPNANAMPGYQASAPWRQPQPPVSPSGVKPPGMSGPQPGGPR